MGSIKEKIVLERVAVEECSELTDKTVFINRCSKVVKGGRRFSFAALVVSGDGHGHVGYGQGKAAEVPDAIRKASDASRKGLIKVPMNGVTIPHDVMGKFGPTTVVLKPGAPGTGVIAGSVVRAVIEAVGIHDIRTKCIGSSNPKNVLQAVMVALLQLKDPEATAGMRGTNIEELGYRPF